MNKSSLKAARVGIVLVGLASFWSVSATWLSANQVISVVTEFICYYFAIFAAICGGLVYLSNGSQSKVWLSFLTRCTIVFGALLIILTSALGSNKTFFYWKLRAIPADAWQQMVSDLESVGRQSAAADGSYGSFRGGRLPVSLSQLGLDFDFMGATGELVNRSDYNGVVAHITFGNKNRNWGLWVGPEKIVKGYCPRCKWIRVTPNAFFYVGTRG